MSADGKKIWETYPQNLVCMGGLSKEFKYLTSPSVQRAVRQEVREKFIAAALADKRFDKEAGVVFLKGGTSVDINYYDTDTTLTPFRQESYFQYLFGLAEPDCFGAIFLKTRQAVLFVPTLPEGVARWNGDPKSFAWYKDTFGADAVCAVEDIKKTLLERGARTVYTLNGQNTDSGLWTVTIPTRADLGSPAESDIKLDNKALFPVLSECRVIKTPREIDFMRACCLVTSQAHVFVMRHIRAGMSEVQLEALFRAWTGFFGGSRFLAYTCICASGPNGSILHYGHAGRPNDRILKQSDMMVLDMGGEYGGYSTDITSSYPVSGKFTKDQIAVHNAVRAAQDAVFSKLRPGCDWLAMHRAAERAILTHLKDMGVVRGDVEAMMKVNLGAVFMPHGLGHFIGMDTHDVGGYPIEGPDKKTKDNSPGPRWLRTQRILKAGMVLTVEPGLYFNNSWIAKALQDETKAAFIDQKAVERFRDFGGVRLEDDVLITKNGYENFTRMPKTWQEYEEVVGNYNPTCEPCA